MMRFLTVQYGILFAESRDTVTSMHEETPNISQKLGTFRRWFRPLHRVYGIKRKAIKTEHLTLYHLFAEPETRKVLVVDCHVMKVIHDTYESNHRVTADDISTIAAGANLDQSSAELSVERYGSCPSPFMLLSSKPCYSWHLISKVLCISVPSVARAGLSLN
jgi:hypothetical protein